MGEEQKSFPFFQPKIKYVIKETYVKQRKRRKNFMTIIIRINEMLKYDYIGYGL